jgi:hypothetical protein
MRERPDTFRSQGGNGAIVGGHTGWLQARLEPPQRRRPEHARLPQVAQRRSSREGIAEDGDLGRSDPTDCVGSTGWVLGLLPVLNGQSPNPISQITRKVMNRLRHRDVGAS